MLKKVWKFNIFIIITVFTEIIIHTTDLILESESTSKTILGLKRFLFIPNFSFLVLGLFIIAAFFLGAGIQELFFGVKESISREEKEFQKHKKIFDKKREKFHKLDRFDVYYEISYLLDGSPHACNLKFYDRENGVFYEAHNRPILYDRFNQPVIDVNIIKSQINTYLQQLWHGIL